MAKFSYYYSTSLINFYKINERAYWYSLFDLPKSKEEIELTTKAYKVPAEHALGLVTENGVLKPAYDRFNKLLST